MSILHYGATKLVLCASITVAAAVAAMDPTTKGYVIAGCIAAIPPTITGLLNHWKIATVEHKVDGMNTALRAEKKEAETQLVDTSKQLAHAEGVKQGSDAERATQKEDKPKP
jgi:hypothetical protein